MRHGRGSTAASMLVAAIAGCGGPGREAERSAAPEPSVESAAERGPVKMTVRASPGAVSVGERLRLTVTVTAETGVDVEMPEIGESVGEFAVRSRQTPPDVPDGALRRSSHAWELDTFAAGTQEIPALTARFTDRRAAEPISGEVTSAPLSVEVRSVLAAEEGPDDYRDIRGAVDIGAPGSLPRWWIWPAAAVALAAAAAIVLAARRRRREHAEPAVPPHVRALARLAELRRLDLPRQGLFQRYYFSLSDIVRQYIEERFGLMAPERTTEEFLREARASRLLSDEQKALLAGFLRAADMVKFALHEPAAGEADDALERARGFVEQTIPVAREAAA